MKSYLERLPEVLPRQICGALSSEPSVYELCLRPGRRTILSAKQGKKVCDPVIDEREFERIFLALIGGSCYKHEHTLPRGYFIDVLGGRCGVAGEVITDAAGHRNLRVRSLHIRIPRFFPHAADELVRHLASGGLRSGILIFAPPCTGKTTVIRALAGRLSCAPYGMCVCVADERGEFCESDYTEDANLDLLTGYTKAEAVEIAVRSLAAEVILCDEIGDFSDLEQMRMLSCSGVPLIATAHAGKEDELRSKQTVRRLCEAGLISEFAHLIGFSEGVAHFDYSKA